MNLLETIVDEFEHDNNTLSVVLIGSGSRGELDVFSDLDIHVVVRGDRPPNRIFYREGRLVTINFVDCANREAMLTDPWMALRNLAAAREAQILFDPDLWYEDLQQRARAFTWQKVSKEADRVVSYVLAENAEEVQKILGGLRNNQLEKTLYATTGLVLSLSNVSALANGVLCNSENRFWSAVRDAENDPEWKMLYWRVLGFDGESITTRANAALRLYNRSSLLYQAKLLPQHIPIIEHVRLLITAQDLA
jgi:predicted nucleotidyltransferase